MIQVVSKVYIIGFMGSGKTTVGKRLAAILKWHFVDLDNRIESYLGMSVADIFQLQGEEYFRVIESQVLKGLRPEKDTIISTGGGTPCSETNMEYMLETGLTIYLRLSPEQLVKRLSASGESRPLLKNVNAHDLYGFINLKLAEREKWYNRANLIIDGFSIDYQLITSLIKNWYQQ